MSKVHCKKLSYKFKANAVFLFLLLFLCFLHMALAADQKKVAVLELSNKAGITDDEANFLTDKVRDMASRTLAQKGFLVVTKESIYDLLPPGTDYKNVCTSAQCEIEVGRLLGVDYIVTGEIIKYADDFIINLKVHHCYSGAFLGAESAEGVDKKAIKDSLDQASIKLFNKVLIHSGPHNDVVIETTPPSGWDLPKGEMAVVNFRSKPAGAVVEVDGILKCRKTPCTREIPVGQSIVSMQHERYQAKKEAIQIIKEMNPIIWNLRANFGLLSVTSVPSGLNINIENVPIGKTPLYDHELEPGHYKVAITDPKYYEKGKRLSIQAGDKKDFSFTMLPREGGVKVSAQDKNGDALIGELFFGGKSVGSVPGKYKVLIGKHNAVIRTVIGDWSGTIEIKEHEIENLLARIDSTKQMTPSMTKQFSESSIQDKTGYPMTLIPAGTFIMGCDEKTDPDCYVSEKPWHSVYVKKYYIHIYEVTVNSYQKCVKSGNCSKPTQKNNCNFDDTSKTAHPINCVNWYQARKFCKWIGGDLPTEAEWEKAARGKGKNIYPWGNDWNPLYVNGYGEADRYSKTAPVGNFPNNASSYGVYDMSGNVGEWARDWAGDYRDGEFFTRVDVNGKSRLEKTTLQYDQLTNNAQKVIRGGGYLDPKNALRVTSRIPITNPMKSGSYLGFRCVKRR